MYKYTLPTKFVVDRSKWLRGEGFQDSFLLRPADDKQCCIGFLAGACGFTKEHILGTRGLSCVVRRVDLSEVDDRLLSFSSYLEQMDIVIYARHRGGVH